MSRVFLLCALAAFCACGSDEAPPRLPPLADDAVLLAFGDSLTRGFGATAAASYPAQLAARISREVVNAGRNGETTEQARARLPGVLDNVQPALLILCHGGNDLLRRLAPARTENNLREMLRAARARGVPVLLIGVPAPGRRLRVPAFYPKLAREFGAAYEGEVLARVLSSRTQKSDLVHPNAAGYRGLAHAVAEQLAQSGAL